MPLQVGAEIWRVEEACQMQWWQHLVRWMRVVPPKWIAGCIHSSKSIDGRVGWSGRGGLGEEDITIIIDSDFYYFVFSGIHPVRNCPTLNPLPESNPVWFLLLFLLLLLLLLFRYRLSCYIYSKLNELLLLQESLTMRNSFEECQSGSIRQPVNKKNPNKRILAIISFNTKILK